ncbi:MAG: hypothetical protein AB7F65_08005 [Dehalococcoidia bacterium]
MPALANARRAIVLGLAIALVAVALLPGAWGTALAQTAGPVTSTDPTTGTTTTTTTQPDGTRVTETVRTDGTTSTVTETPSGETTTVVVVPNQGTVTVVAAPNQPVTVTVAPANPNTDTSLQVDVLATTLSVPAGTLSADETISIVEQSFTLAIVLGIQDATQIGFNTQSQTTAPGTIVPVRVFELGVQKADGSSGQIAQPIEMTWEFTPDVLLAAGGDFANLLMITYDPDTETWSQVKQVSHTATSATFEVPHFSLWAFAYRAAAPAVPTPADTGMGAAEETGATNPLAIALGAAALLGIAGLGARFAIARRSV